VGADAVINALTAPAPPPGTIHYYEGVRQAAPNQLALDPALGHELWERTEAAIHEASR
jgi:hypothetical protein